MSIKPTKKHLIVFRDEEAHKELYKTTSIELPESAKSTTQVSMVLDVGSVDLGILPMDKIVTKKFHTGMTDVIDLGGGKFLIPFSLVVLKLSYGKSEDGSYYRTYIPFGSKVLARRLTREFKSKAGIIIPEHTEYLEQTKFSEVIEVGPDCTCVSRGDVIFTEWNSAIVEVGLGSSESDYYCVFPLEGIRFSYEGDPHEIHADFRQPSENEIKFRKAYEKKHKAKR